MPMSSRRLAEQRRVKKALHLHGLGLDLEEISSRLGMRPKTVRRLLARTGVQISSENKGGNK
jgi:DNA-directed RNA polymerase specialized sigma24 family protein